MMLATAVPRSLPSRPKSSRGETRRRQRAQQLQQLMFQGRHPARSWRLHTVVRSKRYKQIANLVVVFQWMPKRQLWVELIAVAPPIALTREIAVCDKFSDDALGSPLGNAHCSGDIPQPHPRIFGNTQQKVRVMSEKGPVSHVLTIDDTRYAMQAIASVY